MLDPPLPKSVYVIYSAARDTGVLTINTVSTRHAAWMDEHDPHRYVLAEVTDEMVERAARELVRQQSQGCVSWEDTTDTNTTGDAVTRHYAMVQARAVLVAALSTQ